MATQNPEGNSRLYDDIMAGFEELREYARGERELRVTTLQRSETAFEAASGEIAPYVVLFEQGPLGWAATVPDFPGCVANAATMEEAEQKIRREMQRYVKASKKEGRALPAPITRAKELTI